MSAVAAAAPSLALIFALGLRHGLDPDHIAVIDNMTLRAVETGQRAAPFTGTLFAIGHSLSVGIVALSVAAFASELTWPAWIASVIDWMVVVLLLLVGTMNLRGLLRPADYAPAGWRHHLIPARLRGSTQPLAVVAVGAIFGLVFDTATQAAAWGAAAAAGGGLIAAGGVALAFAGGMILTDTADSLIVTRLLRGRGDRATLRRYRRGIGWLVVVLSFGMAAYAAVSLLQPAVTLPDDAATALGVLMAVGVIAVAWGSLRAGWQR